MMLTIKPNTSTPDIKAQVEKALLNGEVVEMGNWKARAVREGHYEIQFLGKVVWTPRNLSYTTDVVMNSWLRD